MCIIKQNDKSNVLLSCDSSAVYAKTMPKASVSDRKDTKLLKAIHNSEKPLSTQITEIFISLPR